MKTFQLIPALRNADELQKIIGLIRECIEPKKIILIGRYADMQLASVLGGYEFLIITRELPTVSALEIQRHIDKAFSPACRSEKRLFIYLLSYDFIAGKHHINYFFHLVNMQGYVIYEDDNSPLWKKPGFKSVKALHTAKQNMERCLELGNCFLQEAHSHLSGNNNRFAAFMIYQAVRQFFTAIVLVNYGFEPHEENSLIGAYSLVRHTSEPLAALWDLADTQSKGTLKRIHSFNHAARFAHNFTYPLNKLEEHVRMLHLLAHEAQSVCRARIDLLTNGIPLKQYNTSICDLKEIK